MVSVLDVRDGTHLRVRHAVVRLVSGSAAARSPNASSSSSPSAALTFYRECEGPSRAGPRTRRGSIGRWIAPVFSSFIEMSSHRTSNVTVGEALARPLRQRHSKKR